MSGKYRTIVADPPWEVARAMGKGGRRRNRTVVPYSFMSIEAIKALPVSEWAAADAVLFLWSTRRLFREGTAAAVARAWGFEPCGELIWGLRNPGMGTPSLANDHEPCLVASRGRQILAATEPLGVYFVLAVALGTCSFGERTARVSSGPSADSGEPLPEQPRD